MSRLGLHSRDAWRMRLVDYLGHVAICDDPAEDSSEIVRARDFLHRMMKTDGAGWTILAVPDHPDLSLRHNDFGHCVVHDTVSGDIVGGYTPRLAYLFERWRNIGLAARIHLVMDQTGKRRLPTHYSRSGRASRVRAHRLHITTAMRAGLEVPGPVLSDHGLSRNWSDDAPCENLFRSLQDQALPV